MSPTLLPDPSRLRLEYLSAYDDAITMVVTTTAAAAYCPLCHQPSIRRHSQYTRIAADLPWNGVAVHLRLTTRRFFCVNDACRRKIFTERLPALMAPYARRTVRLTEALELIGFALGGEAGARTLAGLSMMASADTVLRVIRRAVLPARKTPRVLGVDDFAFRKRHTYGTLLVDLERRCRVDLLPDRAAETLARWLAEHPGVEVISRDRGGAYADGARQGAPEAVQVADRFHLLCNLSETVERVLTRKHRRLREAAHHDPPSAADRTLTGPEQQTQARRGTRVHRYETVRRLYHAGMTQTEIARTMAMSRNTVSKYIRAEGFPERLPKSPGPANLLPYHAYLAERWEAGCHNGRMLWEEVRDRGYTGSIQTVQRYLGPWRLHPRRGPSPLPPTPLSPATPHRAARFFTQPVDSLRVADQAYLQRLRRLDPELDHLACLADTFRRMLYERDAEALDGWLEQARGSGIADLARFADHLQRDHAAVHAALSLPWSNGQTEGQINRLKTLKRHMYGRANFDLLRKRVLHAA